MFALDDFDLYRYGPTDKLNIERTGFVLKLAFYETFDDLQRSFRKVTKNEKVGEVRGYTMVSRTVDVCTVHVVKPKIWDDREAMAILGHEVYHCTFSNHKTVVEGQNQGKTDEDKLNEQDRKLELEGLKEECKSNTTFDYIAGCKELQETK